MVVLVELCWTLLRFHTSSTAAIDYTCFPIGIAVKTWLVGRTFAKIEDLGVVKSAMLDLVLTCCSTAERGIL